MARPRIQKYLDLADIMRCPVCHAAIRADEPSLRCENGHRFDISAKGFLTMVPNCGPLKGYDAAFFESRARVMEAGIYTNVLEGIAAELPTLDDESAVLDAGCGEGYYAKAVRELTGAHVIGLDYSKDAIRCAARGGNPACWLVADLANIPLADNSIDCILNVYTPANYHEFKRVLKPGGRLIKAVPGSRHFGELRTLLAANIKSDDYSNDLVLDHFEEVMGAARKRRATMTSQVPRELAQDLITMSPIAFGLDKGSVNTEALTEITVDAEILVAES